ncbi:MAG: 3-hydroxyacyl-ACP dehydratase [Bacteroidota bacterium]
MILAGTFYTVVSEISEAERINAVLELNADHEIFHGHFPGQPVVPGVCMMQIVKELMETVTGKTLRLHTGLDLKFLSVIDPGRNSIIHAEINYSILATGDINATARLFYSETTFFKFKGVFTS